MSDLFSIYWWDLQGNQHTELRWVSLDEVRRAWERLTCGPAAKLGITQRVLVTDSLDCTVAEYKCPPYHHRNLNLPPLGSCGGWLTN